MRNALTLPLTALLACGPIPSPNAGSTTNVISTTSSSEPTDPTTLAPTTLALTTASTDTSTTDTQSHDFVVMPADLGPPIQCDVWTQDCPPGQKCAPWADGGDAWNATKCVDITGNGAPGEPCTAPEGGVAGIDDCALGSFCWNVDENNHGFCAAQCTGFPNRPMCPPQFTCFIAGVSVLNLCIATCDPLLQDCLGTDLCIHSGDEFLCFFDASGDEGQANDPCEFLNGCDKGLVCLNPSVAASACQQDATGCCQPFCKFPGTPCPNPDQECVSWFDPMMPVPPEYKDVGVCAIPL